MLGKTKLQSLIEKSENIISVFEKTKNDISKVNDEIETEAVNRLDKIRLLNSEIELLNAQKYKNIKILSNINKFFE